MKIKQDQLEKLARLVLEAYRASDWITVKGDPARVSAKIKQIVTQNFAEEEAIEEEARKMLASHAQAARNMDHYKMFLMAKQKLASKRGFVL